MPQIDRVTLYHITAFFGYVFYVGFAFMVFWSQSDVLSTDACASYELDV